jgi:4-aminobutyrate aminotransferase/(S)-3-amino-2-methylpropionate transaminase
MELVRDRSSKEPATDEGRRIGQYCFSHGLILSVRRNGSVLRFLPPATTTPGQINAAMDVLAAGIELASTRRNPA